MKGRFSYEALAAAVTDDLKTQEITAEVMLGHVDVHAPDVAEVSSANHESRCRESTTPRECHFLPMQR